MNNIGSLPYSEIEIDRFGNLVDPLSLDSIAPAENLFVMAHGWNSTIDDARGLYTNFFTQFLKSGAPATRCAVLGILWPSEKSAPPAEIPGGAASVRHAIDMLLNLTSYHLMKDRAGTIGRTGLARSLDQIHDDYPGIRIHLAGHSFGCRAITAAAAAVRKPVASMTLFQAAFSHNSFSPDFDSTHQPGGFRSVIDDAKCAGPIVITHSINDEAVGICYPIASRILRQQASSLGGADDRYGALGRNGARHTPEAVDTGMLPEHTPYNFVPGRIFNLQADNIIQAHTDIVHPETAWALLSAAGLDRA